MVYNGEEGPSEKGYAKGLDLWDVNTGKFLGTLGGVQSPVNSFFSGGEAFFTSHEDGAIFAWDQAAIDSWCADRKKAVAPESQPANQ
jgi:WD40 repeat protein